MRKIRLLGDYFPKEYQASSLIVSYGTISSGNGDVPVGGSLAMVNRMLKRYEDLPGGIPVAVTAGKFAIARILKQGSFAQV